jgi:hypothetical protein
MALIRNNNATALQVGGVAIPGRGEADVPNWASALERSRVIQSWVKVGILQVVGDSMPPVAEPPKVEPETAEDPTSESAQEAEQPDEAAERADLFAALAELGIKAGGRTGTDKLRAMLADARAANADSNTEG